MNLHIFNTGLYSKHLSIPTVCITLDQPLWLKTVEIITKRSLSIVCRLRGFYTMMSFLGRLGGMVKGQGLEDALEQVYGHNIITQMMTGKAVLRVLHGHFLVESALVSNGRHTC